MPLVIDPLEWWYAYTLARAVLGGSASFHLDAEAAEASCALGDTGLGPLASLPWRRAAIYFPGFRRVLGCGDCVSVAVEGYTARRLVEAGLRPDVVVGDADWEPESYVYAGVRVVHVHGDNYRRVLSLGWRPEVVTVQSWPRCNVLLPGFTDGDRAAYLAHYMGAEELYVVGSGVDVGRAGPGKVAVARHLLARLKNLRRSMGLATVFVD